MNRTLATVALSVMLASSIAQAANQKPAPEVIARGKDLVKHGMCHDCHTPKTFEGGKMGFDYTRELSGHPADSKMPPIDKKALQPGYWVMATPDLTAWVGPWGVSYAANLTPDDQTGTGLWTADVFIKAVRTGKHMGEGRPILPPMPYEFVGDMSDDDLKAIFAYMHSLKPIKNVVPQPVAPPDVK